MLQETDIIADVVADDLDTLTWKVIHQYFEDNPAALVKHQLDSYNAFLKDGLTRIFREKNPLLIKNKAGTQTCKMYMGGRDGTAIYYNNDLNHLMPNEARLRNITYDLNVTYDVLLIIVDSTATETEQVYKNIHLTRFPIMLMSDRCILKDMSRLTRFEMGECRNDYGGYFIIDGKEKCIITQEQFASNMLNVTTIKKTLNAVKIQPYSHSISIRSMSDRHTSSFSLNIKTPPASEFAAKQMEHFNMSYSNQYIEAIVPHVTRPVPLFILMRALGVLSDEQIIDVCLLDKKKYKDYVDLFRPSVHDAGLFFTQEAALTYLKAFTRKNKNAKDDEKEKNKDKDKDNKHVLDFLLPHIGVKNYLDKAYFIGYMVKELLMVFTTEKKPTDRDSFRFKRLELPGTLLYQLFNAYYLKQLQAIKHTVETLLLDNDDDLKKMFQEVASYVYIFKTGYKVKEKEKEKENLEPLNQIVAAGIRRAFKGAWGADEFTKRDGIVQDLDRLSYNSYLAQLTKTNLTTKGEKMVQPRKLHMSHWGMIDPIDTPDGAHTGLHKHLTIGAMVTSGFPAEPIIAWMKNVAQVKLLAACSLTELDLKCKVFVNGGWIGMLDDPPFVKRLLLNYRRVGLLPQTLSIYWDITQKVMYLNTDAGRIMRPVYYVDQMYKTVEDFRMNNALPKGPQANVSYNVSKNKRFKWDWQSMIKGAAAPTDEVANAVYEKVYGEEDEEEASIGQKPSMGQKKPSMGQKKPSNQIDGQIENLLKLYPKRAMLEYLDNSESEGTLIAMSPENPLRLPYTHIEIHPSLLFSVMSNQVNFLANNPLARDMFSCSQTKQAVSIYHTNFPVRMDKSAHVLHYGQTPLVKSRYLQYINHEENPCGENAIVAIMSYNGFNVEDSILFNEGSIKRGLFNSTAYTTYQGADENALNGDEARTKGQIFIRNPLEHKAVGMNSKYKYELLNADGLINVNEPIDDKTVLIGRVALDRSGGEKLYDASIFPKKGQEGFVDKCYLSEDKEGFRIAKVKIREERIPAVGDKFSSRCGQKGTIGLVIPEADMPFTERGMRPDIIINPHAFPSRQTVGQLIEGVMAKACAIFGGYGDCTAFVNNKEKENPAIDFGDLLAQVSAGAGTGTGAGAGAGAYHSSGTEVLYNGSTGEQLEANIFIGPTFYMRLKHMPKDKINYRNEGGPREALTRQPTQGRANDGGLRIGEMDRDALIAHGVSGFLNESMMKRGDEFYLAVCNRTGSIAVYNEAKHLFLSPMIDGPLAYDDVNDKNKMISDVCVQNVNKFPYNFSVVRVPYAFKLLMQELTTMMNVHMRLITSDNVDQMKSLTFSDNMDKLIDQLETSSMKSIDAVTSMADTSMADTSMAGMADTSMADTSMAGMADTSMADTSMADTSMADTSMADTSMADIDTSIVDIDTSIVDIDTSMSPAVTDTSMADTDTIMSPAVTDTSMADTDTSMSPAVTDTDTSMADTRSMSPTSVEKTFESASLQAANLATPEVGNILAMEERTKNSEKNKIDDAKETRTIQI